MRARPAAHRPQGLQPAQAQAKAIRKDCAALVVNFGVSHTPPPGWFVRPDSSPSWRAGVHGTRCKRSRARTRRSCRAGSRPAGLPSERLRALPTTRRRFWRAPTLGWRSGGDPGAPPGMAARGRSHPGAVGEPQPGVALAGNASNCETNMVKSCVVKASPRAK
jgi:hypothetical protein